MRNMQDGARIKVWPNTPSAASGDLQGGGGAGRVNNITYDTMRIANVAYAIEVDQCYGQRNLTLCYAYPSPLTISNVRFTNFRGRTSAAYAPLIAAFACSSAAACANITAEDIGVVGPGGGDEAYCDNVAVGGLDVTCVTKAMGFN